MGVIDMRLKFVGALAIAALAASATQALADDHFGAIAYSTSSGSYGYSYDYSSRGEAEDRALAECSGDCKVVLWFKNACGALAVGNDHGYGTAWAGERGEAEATAMGYCRQYSQGCQVVRWVCTTR